VFDSVTIEGSLTTVDLVDAGDDVAAVRWSSSPSAVSRNVTWNNCKFSKFTYATDTQQQIQGVTFSNCDFDTLHQGIVLGGAVPVDGGATGVRVVQNTFDNIHSQGIVIDGVSHNATAYNTFYDVGNGFNGSAFPATGIIVIDAENNVSIGHQQHSSGHEYLRYHLLSGQHSKQHSGQSTRTRTLSTHSRYSG